MDLEAFKKEQDRVEALLKKSVPLLRYKITKKKFETMTVQWFSSLGELSKAVRRSDGETITLCYLDGFHVSSWSKGEGWFIYLPKSGEKS